MEYYDKPANAASASDPDALEAPPRSTDAVAENISNSSRFQELTQPAGRKATPAANSGFDTQSSHDSNDQQVLKETASGACTGAEQHSVSSSSSSSTAAAAQDPIAAAAAAGSGCAPHDITTALATNNLQHSHPAGLSFKPSNSISHKHSPASSSVQKMTTAKTPAAAPASDNTAAGVGSVGSAG